MQTLYVVKCQSLDGRTKYTFMDAPEHPLYIANNSVKDVELALSIIAKDLVSSEKLTAEPESPDDVLAKSPCVDNEYPLIVRVTLTDTTEELTRVNISLTQGELQKIDRRAKAAGMSRSAFLRHCVKLSPFKEKLTVFGER